MRLTCGFLSLAFCFLVYLPAYALPTSVKVSLFQAHPEFTSLTVDGAFEMAAGSSSPSASLPLQHAEISLGKGGLLWTTGRGKPRRAAVLFIRPHGAPLRLKTNLSEARPYRGRLLLTASGGRLNVVNEVDSKSYITSVVGSESLPDFSLEALKTQAVLASTVLARQRPNAKLSDSTEVQAYLGSDYERPLAKQAVDAVFGETLATASGTTPAVFYHSTCAGGTSDEREIFSGKTLNDASRKLVSSCRTAMRVKCSYCKDSPFFKPHIEQVSTADLIKKVGCVPLSIDIRDPQARPLSVSVEKYGSGAKPSKVSLSGYELWLKLGKGLGWGAVPGMRYSFEKNNGKVTITSSGAGHGAGLCQWGASGMARSGKTYKEILQYYFPLAQLGGKEKSKDFE